MHPAGIFFIVLVVLVIVGGVGWLLYVRWRAQKLGLPPPTIASFNPFRKSQPSLYDSPQHPAPGGGGGGGVTGWINDKLRSLRSGRNTRTAAGAYEGAAGVPAGGGGRTRGGRGGGGALDPDEAWDTRVGNETDGYYEYEDQELGLHPQHGGGTYQMNLATELGDAPSSTMTTTAATTNPFGDDSRHEYEGRGRAPAAAAAPASFKARAGGANPFDDDVADSASNISLRGVSPRPISTAAPGGAQKSGRGGGSPTERAERRSIFRENV